MEFDRIEAIRIGQELKKIRKQRGLSLAEVESLSEGRWKAVVVGSYERADRAITIGRLGALMALYQAPISALFPQPEVERDTAKITFDLARRSDLDRQYPGLANFLTSIINTRGDWNGHILSIRESDLHMIARYEFLPYSELREKLEANKFLLQWR